VRARAAPPALTIRAVPVILVAGLSTTSHAHVAHPWCTSGRGWGPRLQLRIRHVSAVSGERAALYCRLRSQPRDRPVPAGRIASRSAERALMREFSPQRGAAAQGAPALRAMQAR